jgi:hypothetical protein
MGEALVKGLKLNYFGEDLYPIKFCYKFKYL